MSRTLEFDLFLLLQNLSLWRDEPAHCHSYEFFFVLAQCSQVLASASCGNSFATSLAIPLTLNPRPKPHNRQPYRCPILHPLREQPPPRFSHTSQREVFGDVAI